LIPPLAAFRPGQENRDPERQARWINWAPFSDPFDLTQQGAASVPYGSAAAGLR
jgi:aspartyl-tRNA(Asn)/glutamyl-tRNA(Gln) amidotransferase subunit A